MNDYLEYKKNIEEILPKLKEAYIAYYGEEYRNKINEKIDSIKIYYYDDFGKILSNLDNENNLVKDRILSLQESIVYSNGNVIPDTYPPIILIKVSNPINLHTIVHEINHTLHTKKVESDFLSVFSLLPTIKTFTGFTGHIDDYFYEIINEYMTKDILDKLQSLINSSDKYDFSFSEESYIYLDRIVTDGKLFELYNNNDNKKEIAKSLINCNGNEFYKKNEKIYDYLNYSLSLIGERNEIFNNNNVLSFCAAKVNLTDNLYEFVVSYLSQKLKKINFCDRAKEDRILYDLRKEIEEDFKIINEPLNKDDTLKKL